MSINFRFLIEAVGQALRYTHITLILAISAMLIGMLFGGSIALIRVFKIKFWGRFFNGFILFFRGIPVVLLLLITQFAFLQNIDILADKFHFLPHAMDVNTLWIAVFALSLAATVALSESLRGSLLSVPQSQYEAGYSVGMTRLQLLRRIIIPQMLPVAMPMLCNGFIRLIKNSSIATMLPTVELLGGAVIAATSNYLFLEAYLAAGLVFWGICFLVERLGYFLERKMSVYIKGRPV
jgi:L-cystine transport system permease protein